MLFQAILVTLCLSAIEGASIEGIDSPDRIANEYIVTLHPQAGVKATKLQYIDRSINKIHGMSDKLKVVRHFVIHEFLALELHTEDEVLVSAVGDLPEVQAVQVNLMMYSNQRCVFYGNDDLYWGLRRIPSRTSSANFVFDIDANTSGTGIYVLDTGIRTSHQEFGGRAIHGWTGYNDNGQDVQGHGTHCAGTAGGTWCGVGKGATIINVKVLSDSGSGSTSIIIAGVEWAASRAIPNRVISMSLGGGANSATDSAVNAAVSGGSHVIVAAGNDNTNACNFSPARASQVITVGSTQQGDSRSSFSNFGSCVDIFAPGTGISSASHQSNTGYRTLSGTSMACPHVAGLVARYLAERGSAHPTTVRNWLRNTSTKGVISNVGSGSPNELLFSSCPL